MVMRLSSKTIAGDGIQHRAGEKAQADDYEQKVEHGSLSFRPFAAFKYAPSHKNSRRKGRYKNKIFIRLYKNKSFIRLWQPVERRSVLAAVAENARLRAVSIGKILQAIKATRRE
jgi:hypothetical protein